MSVSSHGLRGAHGTQLGASAPELRSPPFSAAAVSAPLSTSSGARALAGRTLLETSGHEERRRAFNEATNAAAMRPVPTGREWRNPSRPPPPTAAFEAETSFAHIAADIAAESVERNPRGLNAAALTEPHFVMRALAVANEFGASDLHLHSGSPVCARVDGQLFPLLGEQLLSRAAAERVIAELLDETQRTQLLVDGEVRFAYEMESIGCLRAHAYAQERGTDLVVRILPKEIGTAEKLGLAAALRTLRDAPAGLCVCSGPAGSGKTTSLAVLVHALSSERALHVVSIEQPIELIHDVGLGLVERREVGVHVASFAEGIEWAERQAADLIVVADLSAPGALAASLHAARARCLVLAGLRASSAANALAKLINSEPAQSAELSRFELAQSLRLLLNQRLLPRARGAGRVAAFETVPNSSALAQLIREDKLQQLPAAMAAGKAVGMSTLDDALDELFRSGVITSETKSRASRKRDRFKVS
jgi:twitching motility protein PilT